ncbi:MAG: hypothetical protein ACEPOV_02070 [Hyphomicrobiales bacterium]
MKLNPDFEVKVKDEDSGQILLKNKRNETIITLSAIEYDMLKIFAETDDVVDILDKYSGEYDIDYSFIKALIGHGVRLKVLVEDDYMPKESVGLHKLRWVFTKLLQITGLSRLGFRTELTGGYKLFKFVSIDLKGKWLERLLSTAMGQKLSIIIYFVLLILGGIYLFFHIENGLNWGIDADIPVLLIFVIAFAGIFILSFLHESGHYVMYKKFGGHSNEMGMATSNLILPIFYTSTYTMHFWKNKKHKLLVTASGIFVDIFLLILMLDINIITEVPAVMFFSLLFAFFMVIRLVGNLNPLIPGTDGYFIVVDGFELQSWLNKLNTNFFDLMRLFKEKKLRAFGSINKKHLGSICYAFITFVMITVYWLLIIFLIFIALFSF